MDCQAHLVEMYKSRNTVSQNTVSQNTVSLIFLFMMCMSMLFNLGCDVQEEANTQGGDAQGGDAQGGDAQGGDAQGGDTQGGDAQGGDTQGGDAQGGDTQGGDTQGGDTQEERAMLTGCQAEHWRHHQFLLPNQRTTQIHPAATWDGEAFWVTWNIPNEEGKFEVWAGRFGCDLEPIIPAFAVSQVSGMNDVDPAIAFNDGVILIAWARDDGFSGETQYNLSTQLQTYDAKTGEPLGEVESAPIVFEMSDSEQIPLVGNLWMVRVMSYPFGGFLISGAWGNPEKTSFQVYLQRLSTERNPVGGAWLVDEEGRDQVDPEILVSPDGVIDVLWSGNREDEVKGFWARTWSPIMGMRGGEQSFISSDLINLTQHEWVGAHLGRDLSLTPSEAYEIPQTPIREQLQRPWFIGATSGGRVEMITPDEEFIGVGSRSGTDLAPRLHYGLLTSYQVLRGTQHKVWWRSISSEGETSELHFFEQTGPAAPYPLSITAVRGGYLILWAQGLNPDFMIYGTLLPINR